MSGLASAEIVRHLMQSDLNPWEFPNAVRPASFWTTPVAKFREYLPRPPCERKTKSPTYLVDIAVWGDGVMEIDRCSDGGRPNPVEGSNSRNFALPDKTQVYCKRRAGNVVWAEWSDR